MIADVSIDGFISSNVYSLQPFIPFDLKSLMNLLFVLFILKTMIYRVSEG